ncbi:hypothetical protein AAC387_Pa01g1007 [Persea americana]
MVITFPTTPSNHPTLSPLTTSSKTSTPLPLPELRLLRRCPHPCPPSSAITTPREIPVHRCIFYAQSPFLCSFFSTTVDANPAKEEGWNIKLKELAKGFDLGYDSLVSVLAYLYSGKARPLSDGVCICTDEKCSLVVPSCCGFHGGYSNS